MSRTPDSARPTAANAARHPVGHAGRPAAASDRGSVLIFVVGVLLLLAIVATAFLGSSRSDRISTQQNAFNTSVDLLLDGVVNAAKGQVLGDETVPGGTTSEPFDAVTFSDPAIGPAAQNDDWIASRTPATFEANSTYSADVFNSVSSDGKSPGKVRFTLNGVNPAMWPAVSAPAFGDSFESPYKPVPFTPIGGAGAVQYTGGLIYKQRNQMYPTFVRFGGRTWPAFTVDTKLAPTNNTDDDTRYETFLAADADGDGVADAGLFRIPVGDLGGLTYFGAVRIIDNNAAVNVNTALSRDYDFAGDGSGGNVTQLALQGVFTSNVGLAELLHTTKQATAADTMPAVPTAPFYDHMSEDDAQSEFKLLNRYRFNMTSDRPAGVQGTTAPDNTPYDDATVTIPAGSGYAKLRTDFQWFSIGEALTRDLGERPDRPGVTFGTATRGRVSVVDAVGLAALYALRDPAAPIAIPTTGQPDGLADALAYSLTQGPSVSGTTYATTPTTPYDGLTSTSGIDAWFTLNFNYLNEEADKPLTFANRRTILTAINGVAERDTDATGVPDYLFEANDATGTPLYNAVGAFPQRLAGTAASNLYYYRSNNTDGVQPPMTLPGVEARTGGATAATSVSPKVSINTGRFEELFYGYFKAMATAGFPSMSNDVTFPPNVVIPDVLNKNPSDKGTPFSTLYDTAVDHRAEPAFNFNAANHIYSANGLYYRDPYLGMRFLNGAGFTARGEQVGALSVVNGQTGLGEASSSVVTPPLGVAEQNPLRQFRSALRAAPPRNAAGTPPAAAVWSNATPYLPPSQVLTLRAAIAAANLEALRDSSHASGLAAGPAFLPSNDRAVQHNVPLTAYVGGVRTQVVAHVFGLKRQPFITEVYANANSTTDTVVGANANMRGYVAIKLYNPNPVAIDLRNCRLVGLRRFQGDAAYVPPAAPYDTVYPNMPVQPREVPIPVANAGATDQIDLGNALSNCTPPAAYGATVIPPNGTLVLESYAGSTVGGGSRVLNGPGPTNSPTDDANHRPVSSGITPTIGLLNPPATVNVAYVPGLARVCWDRELVLMRPTNCAPPTGAAAPDDAIVYSWPDNTTGAAAPATVRTMMPLDSYDFTGLNVNDTSYPIRARAEIWYYKRTLAAVNGSRWQWVYPGRYDANQSIPQVLSNVPQAAGAYTPLPRQQGTRQVIGTDNVVGFNVGSDANGDPWDPAYLSTGTANAAGYPAAFPTTTFLIAANADTVTDDYRPDKFTIQLNSADWPSDYNSLLHDTTVAGATPNKFPFGGFRKLADMLQAPFIGSYTIQTEATAGTDTFLEVNPVTIDSALAEDTDLADNERNETAPIDTGVQSREQIGRFIPLRPTYGSAIGANQNGTPALFYPAHDSAAGAAVTPSSLSAINDPGFDYLIDKNGTAATLDPFRYGDDPANEKGDDPARTGGTPAPTALTRLQSVHTYRYNWTSTLFDHFTVRSPSDDYTPNYPTQPKWQPNTVYFPGDTVQYGQNVYVCTGPAAGLPLNAADAPGVDYLDPGTTGSSANKFTATVAVPTDNWKPLWRNPTKNGSADPGSRSNVKYIPPAVPPIPLPPAASVNHIETAEDDTNESTLTTAGLININTASEKVLAALPWSPRTAAAGGDVLSVDFKGANAANPLPRVAVGSDGIDDNAQIAHLIVLWRDGNLGAGQVPSLTNHLMPGGPFMAAQFHLPATSSGTPFTSLYDLYKVPGFRAAQDQILAVAAGPGQAAGDYSSVPLANGAGGAGDGARFDFEEQTLLMNRVSNLATCRSDVFTIYALVQGWRNVGTSKPELVVQRRAAFIVDRGAATRGNAKLKATRVPVN